MPNLGILSGRLEEFRLVELLQAMALGNNTGAVHLLRADGLAGLVYVENGFIVSASELDTEALTLGHVLQQLDLATAEQLEQAYQLQTRDPLGKRIGERLIDLDILTPDQLQNALRTQMLWTVRELALWQSGAYEFHPGEQLPAGTTTIQLNAERTMMEVIRYEHEWETQRRFLPEGMRTHLAMAFDPPVGHSLAFHPASWRVLSRVNGHRTVRRIATALHEEELDMARMLGPLVFEGLLVPIGAAGQPGLPEQAERLSMHNFDLFTLLIEIEQDWLKRKSPADHLVALASYINRTMHTLVVACQENGLTLASDTLAALLAREGLTGIENYTFRIENNHIDVDGLSTFCKKVFDGSARSAIGVGKSFYEDSAHMLEQALASTFRAINARVASPIERAQNQEAWEALFVSFREQGAQGSK